MKFLALLACCVLAGCTDAPTAVEIRASLPVDRGITQLRIIGEVDGVEAFSPGLVPETPRALGAEETSVLLLPDELAGQQLLLRVEATDGTSIVERATGTVLVERAELRSVEIALGGLVAPENEMLTFAFLAAKTAVAVDVPAAILGTEITAVLPMGTRLAALAPSFTATGTTVLVKGMPQTSGVSPVDFAKTVDYDVTSASGEVRTYRASVTVNGNDQAQLLTFGFAARGNPALATDARGTVVGSTITVRVPATADVTALVPTFAAYGEARIDGELVVSGATPFDFSSSRSFTVTTAKGTKTFSVIVLRF